MFLCVGEFCICVGVTTSMSGYLYSRLCVCTYFFLFLCVCLYRCLCVCTDIYVSVQMSVCLCRCVQISVCLCRCLSIQMSMCLYRCLCVCVIAGGRVDDDKHNIELSVFADVPEDAPLWQNEIFGPLLLLKTVKSPSQAIDFINSRPKPLAMYVFTRNSAVSDRMLSEVGVELVLCVKPAIIMCSTTTEGCNLLPVYLCLTRVPLRSLSDTCSSQISV